MEVFFGGQIRQELRGELSVVIAKSDSHSKDKYATFMYPVFSEEFVLLTGFRTVIYPLERVYIGVSHEAGEGIIKRVNMDEEYGVINILENIDRRIVCPTFWNKSPTLLERAMG